MRLRVARITRGFDIKISPILALSMKWVSIWIVASVGLPETYRAVMPEARSANVISNPPCTRPRRLWCLSWARIAYSCSPFTTRCHSGPTRLRNPLVSTIVHPSAFSFAAAKSFVIRCLSSQELFDKPPVWNGDHFIRYRSGVVKRDGEAIRRYDPAKRCRALRSLCAIAGRPGGDRLEAGRGRDHARRSRCSAGRDGASAHHARGRPARPSRTMGAAGRALRRRRNRHRSKPARVARGTGSRPRG